MCCTAFCLCLPRASASACCLLFLASPLPPRFPALPFGAGRRKTSYCRFSLFAPLCCPAPFFLGGGGKKNNLLKNRLFDCRPEKPPKPKPRLKPEKKILGFFGRFSKTRFFLSFSKKERNKEKKEKKIKKEKKKEKKSFFFFFMLFW
jgi:hypothetical protein